MDTRRDPKELAQIVSNRSPCRVKVGAVIYDKHGRILCWGWNSSGPDGYGMCGERHAISRANRSRIAGCSLVVYAFRARTGRCLISYPCAKCWEVIINAGIRRVEYVGPDRKWTAVNL